MLFLALSFVGVAGIYIVLSADFVAMAQMLIYAGAISVLMVFAVMLTPAADRKNSRHVVPGARAACWRCWCSRCSCS